VKAAGVGGPAPPAPASSDAASIQKAGQQLEAFFLRRLLAEARPQGGGMLDGGFAGDTFKEMLDEAVADKVAAAGGLGMGDLFARQLSGGHELPPTAGALGHPTPAGGALGHPTPAGALDFPAPGHAALPGAAPLAMPVIGRATSAYGLRADPVHHAQELHPGLDLAAPTGAPVGAAAGGTVTHAGPAGTYGNLVIIRHDDGLETRYAHLSAVEAKVGARVEPGQVVGRVGSTGNSTGPHLHFEVRRDGKPLDPSQFLSPRSR
jgi:murein DD-endopeptidase MepM/ murein hydrolase activator NlpD